MSCPHGINSTPDTCSMCLGVKPRVIALVDGVVTINGRKQRTTQTNLSPGEHRREVSGAAFRNYKRQRAGIKRIKARAAAQRDAILEEDDDDD